MLYSSLSDLELGRQIGICSEPAFLQECLHRAERLLEDGGTRFLELEDELGNVEERLNAAERELQNDSEDYELQITRLENDVQKYKSQVNKISDIIKGA